jgi:hypothetical protein
MNHDLDKQCWKPRSIWRNPGGEADVAEAASLSEVIVKLPGWGTFWCGLYDAVREFPAVLERVRELIRRLELEPIGERQPSF